MWLVTFLLLLDSLHKGETRAGGRAAGAAEPGRARGEARRGARRAPGAGGDRPRSVLGPGGAQRGRGGHSQRGQVRVCPGPLGRSPAPAVLGRARRGGGGGTPRLPAPGWAAALPRTPPPAPCPLPAAWWRWDPGVPSEWRGPQAVTVLPGVLVYSGLGLRGVLLLRRPALLRRLGPPAPHRMALTRALAGCGRGERGLPRAGVPRMASLFSRPRGRLAPNPVSPPAPGTSPGLAVPPRGHLGQRAPRCETPLQRRVSWTWGQSSVCGGRRVAFPGEKALLGVGPGVRHVQTCCWGAAHLILEVAGTGGWKGTDIYDQSHLGTESGPGCRWLSGFQAITEDVPRGAQMAGDEAAELRALAQRSTHALVPAQLYLFSPLTFLLRALGAASSPPPCPAGGPD